MLGFSSHVAEMAGDAAVAFAVVATVVPPPERRQRTQRKCLNDAIYLCV